jgi:hypothetical protein
MAGKEQLEILRHMLGINDPFQRAPTPHRDYYCADPGDQRLHELASLGLVKRYRVGNGHEWFTTTDAGRAAAIASHKAIRYSKARRVYARFLSMRDVFPDLTFRAFLTGEEFAIARGEA